MNLGIQQTSRMLPRQHKSGQSFDTGRGRSLYSMANAFGLDVSSFGEQAESMWTMLNNLHDSDPAEYELFIKQQMKEMNSANGERSITPEKGFVVKAFVANVNGTRSCNGQGSSQEKLKMFVNFCHHKAIEVPINANGDTISDETTSLANAKVPMVISSLRDFKDASGNESYSIDVILNPWCLQRSLNDSTFKYQMICLGLKSIMEEKKLSIQSNWKLIRSRYKGGLGEEQRDVHPFPVDAKLTKQKNDVERYQPQQLEDNNGIIDDPQRLLQSLRRKRCNHDSDTEMMFQLQTYQIHNKESKSKPLIIQEIDTDVDATTSNLINEIQVSKSCKAKEESMSSKSKNNGDSLKLNMRGFLNKHKNYKVLYKKPSSGDGVKGTGGTYSNLMSKCQIIDTAGLGKESKSPMAPGREEEIFDGDMKKGFLQNEKDGVKEEIHHRGGNDAEFNKIMNQVDQNFARVFGMKSEDKFENKEFEKSIFACGMKSQNNDGSENVGKSLHIPIEPERECFQKKGTSAKIPFKLVSNRETFTIQVDLNGTKVSSIQDIIVEICSNELSVSTVCGGQLRYIHPEIHDKVSAKFKQKGKLLSLTF